MSFDDEEAEAKLAEARSDRKTLENTNAELVNKLADLRAQNEKAEARVKALEIGLVDLRTSIDRGDYNYTPQRILDGLKYEKEARQSETNRANKAESLLAAERRRGK